MKRPKDYTDPKYSRIAIYTILSAAAIYILIKLIDNFSLVLEAIGAGIDWLNVILIPLFWGLVFAYLFNPLVAFFQKQMDKVPFLARKGRAPRWMPVLSVFFLVFAFIVLLLSLVLSMLTSQLQLIHLSDVTGFLSYLKTNVNGYLDSLTSWLSDLNMPTTELDDLRESMVDWVQGLGNKLGAYLLDQAQSIPTLLSNIVFSVIFAIYVLLDMEGIAAYWNRALQSLTSPRFYRGFHNFLDDADRVFSGYIRGTLMDALFMAFAASITLTIVGVPYAIVIGIATGLGNMIPYVGPLIAYASTIVVCLFTGQFETMIIGLLAMLVVQIIDGNVIEPKFLGHAIDIHPMLVIIALLIGGATNGFLGMLVAVPIGALLKIQFDKLVAKLNHRRKVKADRLDAEIAFGREDAPADTKEEE